MGGAVAILEESGVIPGQSRQNGQAPTPETPPENPYLEIDETNIALIYSKIADAQSNILERREAAGAEFNLETPRLAMLGKLNIQPFTPDVNFGVLAQTDGRPYALIYNHNMGCVREPLSSAGVLEQTTIFDGPARGTFLDPGISEIHITPVSRGTRLGSMTVQRFLDEYKASINGIEMTLPVLVVKGFSLNEQAYDCPTVMERVSGRTGAIINRVQQGLSDFELGTTLESAGESLGNAIGRFSEGFERGHGN